MPIDAGTIRMSIRRTSLTGIWICSAIRQCIEQFTNESYFLSAAASAMYDGGVSSSTLISAFSTSREGTATSLLAAMAFWRWRSQR